MKYTYRSLLIGLSLAGGTLMTLTGCQHMWSRWDIDRCASIPRGAIPSPHGSHAREWQRAQVASASADLGVFYQSDFVNASAELSPSGELHLAKIVQQELSQAVPIIVEQSLNKRLDEARLETLQNAFGAAGVILGADRIFIAKPAAHGLDGFRAQQAVRSSMGSQSGGGAGGNGGSGSMGGGGGMGGGFGGGGAF